MMLDFHVQHKSEQMEEHARDMCVYLLLEFPARPRWHARPDLARMAKAPLYTY